MDNYMNLCLELIALRGDAGIPVSQLWGLLADVYQAGVVPECLKQAIWETLLQSEDDVSFTYPGNESNNKKNPKRAPAKKKKKKKKDESSSEEEDSNEDDNDSDDGDDDHNATAKTQKKQKPGPVPRGSPELSTYQTATDSGVHVLASRELQDAALGLYDFHLTRFQMSDVQRKVLSMVGAAGTRGAFQNELANAVGQENRNFFYVIKNLEQRGLVCKRPAIMHASTSANYYTSHVQTNIIHLTKFAPDLAPGARVTDGKHRTTADAVKESEGGLGVLDDSINISRICNQLSSLDGKTALESELKVVLDFRGTKGHRQWRRLRGVLVKRGYIQEFLAYHQEKPVKCIRLLKEYRGEAAEGDDEEDEDAVNIQDLHGEQVAEQTLDRQILGAVIRAGEEGVTTIDLDASIRINMKRAVQRIKELEKRFEKVPNQKVVIQSINQGRMILNRFTATPALLSALESTFAPLIPPGGWLRAVEEAVMEGLDEGEEFPSNLMLTTGNGNDDNGGVGDVNLNMPRRPSRSALQQQQEQKQVDAAAGTITENHEEDQDEDAETESEKETEPAAAAAAKTAAVPAAAALFDEGKKRKRKAQTLIAMQRKGWLVQKVHTDGFMLMAEVGRFLKNKELETGVLGAVAPDRKVYGRIIEQGIEAGELMLLSINFPAVHGSLRNRAHTIVAKPGTQHDEILVNKVWEHYRTYQKQLRSTTHIRHLAELQESRGVALPTVAPQPLLQAAGGEPSGRYLKAETSRRMMENGLLSARMPRVRIIHEVASVAAQVRAANPSIIDEDEEEEVERGKRSKKRGKDESQKRKMYVITMEPTPSPDVQAIASLKDLQGRALMSEEVWEQMRVPQFLKAIGSNSQNKDLLARLSRQNSRMSDLSPQEMTELVGEPTDVDKARSRLTQLLDIMVRMGLLSAVVPVGPQATWTVNTSTVSIYALRQTAQYEEPLNFETAPFINLDPPPPPTNPTAAALAGINTKNTSTDTISGEPSNSGGGIHGLQKTMRSFEVGTPEGRDGYWSSIRLLVARCAAHLGRSGDVLSTCFPFNRTPEAAGERCWTMRAPEHREQAQRAAELLSGRDPGRVDWAACAELARKLGLDYEVIMMWVRDEIAFRERKVRPQRLGGLGGPRKSTRITTTATNLGSIFSNKPRQRRLRHHKRRRRNAETLRELQPGRGRRDANKNLSGDDDEDEEESVDELEEDEDLGEEESGGDEDTVRRGVGSGAAAAAVIHPPERKVLWTADEDRQMLRAWARWLAASGPDKVLYWGHLKDKPPGIRPYTIKRRLRFFARDGAFAALTARLRELAGDVHARKILRTAGRDIIMSSGGATGDQQGLDNAQQPQQQQEQGTSEAEVLLTEIDEPAAKRLKANNAAAGSPPPSGSKRDPRLRALELEQEQEPEPEQAGTASVPSAGIEAATLPAPTPTVITTAAAAAVEGTSKPLEHPDDQPTSSLPNLWPIIDDEDLSALKEVVAVIERIVAAAPKRRKEKAASRRALTREAVSLALPGALSAITSIPGSLAAAYKAATAAAGLAGGSSRSRRSGPVALGSGWFIPAALTQAALLARAKQQQGKQYGQGYSKDALATYPPSADVGGDNNKTVKTNGGGAASSEQHQVTLVVEVAVELMCALVLSGLQGSDVTRALTDRFTQSELIAAAHEMLTRGGLLATSQGLRPSDSLSLELAHYIYPASIFTEADDVLQRIASSATARLDAVAPEGGMVAGALAGVAAGELELSMILHRSSTTTAAASGGGGFNNKNNNNYTSGSVKDQENAAAQGRAAVRITQRPLHFVNSNGLHTKTQSQQRLIEQQQQQQQQRQIECYRDEVYFQPSMVAMLPAIKRQAEAACLAAFTKNPAFAAPGSQQEKQGAQKGKKKGSASNSSSSAVVTEAFHALVSALDTAGPAGITLQDAVATLPDLFTASTNDATVESVMSGMLRMLRSYGLARDIESLRGGGCRWLTAEASQRLMAWPSTVDVVPTTKPSSPGTVDMDVDGTAGKDESSKKDPAAAVSIPSPPPSVPQLTEGWQRLCDQHLLPSPGSLQPLIDAPIRPWTDHKGVLLRPLWNALLRRVVTIVLRHPGIPEHLLIHSMRLMNPRYPLEVFGSLLAAGVLSCETVGSRKADSDGSPCSVLDACFGSGGGGGGAQQAQHGKEKEKESEVIKCYSVVPSKCLKGLGEVLPPHVRLA